MQKAQFFGIGISQASADAEERRRNLCYDGEQ